MKTSGRILNKSNTVNTPSPEQKQDKKWRFSDGSARPMEATFEALVRMDPEEKLKAARAFADISNRLYESVMNTHPQLASMSPAPAPAVVPRGYFLLNISQWDQKELRSLGKQFGVNLRTIFAWGIAHVKCELRETIKIAKLAGVHPRDTWRLVDGNIKN